MTTLLYDGSIALDFQEKGHKYTLDGNPVASVTTVLGALNKPALVGWAAKMTALYWEDLIIPGNPLTLDEVELAEHVKASKAARFKKSNKALEVGNITHDFAEQYALGRNPKLPTNDQARTACEAFLVWWKEHNVQVIAVERKCYSKIYQFCGTVDLLCKIEGHICVCDWKSSSGIFDEYKAQLSAYRQALMEELGHDITGAWVVRFDKDTGVAEDYAMNAAEIEAGWDTFHGALTASRGLTKLKQLKKDKKND